MRCRIPAVLATFTAVVAIVTTATSAPAAFSYGTMQSSCAPWDGPAIGITLSSIFRAGARSISLPMMFPHSRCESKGMMSGYQDGQKIGSMLATTHADCSGVWNRTSA